MITASYRAGRSPRWPAAPEANLNRKEKASRRRGFLWDFTYLCWNLTMRHSPTISSFPTFRH